MKTNLSKEPKFSLPQDTEIGKQSNEILLKS